VIKYIPPGRAVEIVYAFGATDGRDVRVVALVGFASDVGVLF
jgi:hypothetical protein